MKPIAMARRDTADPHFNREAGGASAFASALPIDLVHLTRQTFGDKRLETELLRLFMRQSNQIDKSLDMAGEDEGQTVSSIELLHMLSGSARAIGATEVAAMAGGLEARLRRDGSSPLGAADRASLGGLIAETNRYIAELLDQA